MSGPIQPENVKPSVAEEPLKPTESKQLSLRQISQKDFEINWSLFLLQEAKPLKDLKVTNEKMSLLAKSHLEEKRLLESQLNTQLTINQELQKKVDDQAALVKSLQTQIYGLETQRRNSAHHLALYDDVVKKAERKATAQQELIETQRGTIEELKVCGLGDRKSLDAMVGKLMEEKATLYMQPFIDREEKIKDLAKELDDAEKTIRDLERSERNMGRREQELTEKLAFKDKRLEQMESGIRAQIRDVKLREDAVKERELKIKEQQRRVAAPTESTKEASKELKTAKAQWEKQLKDAERKINGLEQQLKDLTEK
jgi:chromosome segregation ATPase